MTVPSNPSLWSRIKAKHRKTSEGSEPGRWSSRKAALAQREYKKQGGKFNKTKTVPRPLLLRAANKKKQAKTTS